MFPCLLKGNNAVISRKTGWISPTSPHFKASYDIENTVSGVVETLHLFNVEILLLALINWTNLCVSLCVLRHLAVINLYPSVTQISTQFLPPLSFFVFFQWSDCAVPFFVVVIFVIGLVEVDYFYIFLPLRRLAVVLFFLFFSGSTVSGWDMDWIMLCWQ